MKVVCPGCGETFNLPPSWAIRRKTSNPCCSRSCRASLDRFSRPAMPPREQRPEPATFERRFWSKVMQSTNCWLWIGHRNRFNGYGYMRTNEGKHVLAHRASWALSHGDIPAGFSVLHKCDNRLCVRPDHLFLGTQSDNVRDMVEKGRHRGRAKREKLMNEFGSTNGAVKPPRETISLMVADSALRQEIKLAQLILSGYQESLRLGQGGEVDWKQIGSLETSARLLGRAITNLKVAAIKEAEARAARRADQQCSEVLGSVAVYPLALVPQGNG